MDSPQDQVPAAAVRVLCCARCHVPLYMVRLPSREVHSACLECGVIDVELLDSVLLAERAMWTAPDRAHSRTHPPSSGSARPDDLE